MELKLKCELRVSFKEGICDCSRVLRQLFNFEVVMALLVNYLGRVGLPAQALNCVPFSCSFLVPAILFFLFSTKDKIHFMFSQASRLFGNPVFFFLI